MLEINWNPSRRELRQFATIWLPAFAALAGAAVAYRFGSWPTAVAIWALGAGVLLVGLLSPETVKPLFVGWMAAAYPIGWIVSQTVLAITYYALFTLVSFALRVFRHDPLERGSTPARTYWRERNGRSDAAAYFRQF